MPKTINHDLFHTKPAKHAEKCELLHSFSRDSMAKDISQSSIEIRKIKTESGFQQIVRHHVLPH